MIVKSLKATLLATILTFVTTAVKAEIVQDIVEGCSNDPLVSTLCITISPIYTTTILVVVPSEWSGTAWGAKSKVIYKAKNDAATYVATSGKVKGTYLEAALNLLRNENESYKRVDDLTLAKAILVFNQQVPTANQ